MRSIQLQRNKKKHFLMWKKKIVMIRIKFDFIQEWVAGCSCWDRQSNPIAAVSFTIESALGWDSCTDDSRCWKV